MRQNKGTRMNSNVAGGFTLIVRYPLRLRDKNFADN